MKAAVWKVVSIALAAAALIGCTIQPIHNVKGSPVEAVGGKAPSMADVEKAIHRAGAALGWKMQTAKPGLIAGTLNLRTHTAVVDVMYNTKSYDITYKDSVNLDYDGTNIHRNYNGWIQNPDKGIRAQLLNL